MTVERLGIAQIATSSLAAARVLELHGIDYCTDADRSLSEVCAARGLDTAAVQEELADAYDEPPDDRDWTTRPLIELMTFLLQEHVWFRSELTILHGRLSRTAAKHSDVYPGLQHLPAVFARLSDDLIVHMEHEESQVFPAVQRYLEAIDKSLPLPGSPLSAFGGPLRMMETEHESSGATLRLFREFAQNYALPKRVCPQYRMLVRGMLALEDRLLRHIYLENNVLFARAAKLKPGGVSVPQ
jgi:regulator of cell morphogenesis and NO signaling